MSIIPTEVVVLRFQRASSFIHSLTKAEQRVARVVAIGKTDKEIAQELRLSVRTIENHIERLKGKGRKIYGSNASRNTLMIELSFYYFFEEGIVPEP